LDRIFNSDNEDRMFNYNGDFKLDSYKMKTNYKPIEDEIKKQSFIFNEVKDENNKDCDNYRKIDNYALVRINIYDKTCSKKDISVDKCNHNYNKFVKYMDYLRNSSNFGEDYSRIIEYLDKEIKETDKINNVLTCNR